MNLYDRSGAFGAGILEAGDRASSRIAEEREMAEEARMRGEYSWREGHSPFCLGGRTATHRGWEAMVGVDVHFDQF